MLFSLIEREILNLPIKLRLKLTGSESLLYPCFKEVVDLFKERGHFILKLLKRRIR